MRLPGSVSAKSKTKKVAATLMELGLYSIRNARVGDEVQPGITAEARKKLTIAVELIANPSLLVWYYY